jgi:hypothetical protein
MKQEATLRTKAKLQDADRLRARTHKRCDNCLAPYYRSNRIRVWTTVNPGHRAGWMKEDVKLCIKCFSAKKAERVVSLASIHVVPSERPREARASSGVRAFLLLSSSVLGIARVMLRHSCF